METITYLSEPVLNSELVMVNNAKLLKNNLGLLNDQHIPRINILRKEFIELEKQSNQGKTGLQKDKRIIRDEIRELSSKTYTDINTDIFGTMITTIVNRIASRPQFSNYTFIDEMKSLAIEHILLYSYRFDPFRQSKISGQYASAFAYISTISFHAFIATINKFNKEQKKAKDQFLEKQKLIHKEPNRIIYDEEYTTPERTINLPNLKENELYDIIKHTTIKEETEFWIPQGYILDKKITDFILKYEYNISIRRLKDPKEADVSA